MIEEIQIYRVLTAGGTITLRISPHPCIGPLYTVVIPPGPAGAWTGVAFERMWNYDSLFIWVHELAIGECWGLDAVQPYDGHESANNGRTWADMAIRPFIRVVYTGETPGDVPVSGVVNTIEIPSVASIIGYGGDVSVPNNIITEIEEIEGAGTLVEASLRYATSVAPTPGAGAAGIKYRLWLYVDDVPVGYTSSRSLTQSYNATSGRSSIGEFYQGTVADPAWDETYISTRLPVKFRRRLSLRAFHNIGVNVDVNGRILANMVG